MSLKSNWVRYGVGLTLCALLVPVLVSANTVYRSGGSISVAQDQTVEGDFYALGSEVSMSGRVTEDFYTAAWALTANGTVGADLFAVAGVANIHATVTDDVRIVGGEVTIADHVQGDVVVLGGVLKVLSSARIDGDVLFFGDRVEINGPVGGSVMGTYNSLRIDAEIGGDVDVAATTLTVGERAVINGDVYLKSINDLVRAQGATIVGEVTQGRVGADEEFDLRSAVRKEVVPFLISLFAALALYLLFRRLVELVVTQTFHRFGFSTLIGLGSIIAIPFVVIVLLVTVVGALVGAAALLAYLLLLLAAFVLAPVALGVLVWSSLGKGAVVTPLTITVGVALFHIITLVPFLGELFTLLLLGVVFGTLLQLLYKHTR